MLIIDTRQKEILEYVQNIQGMTIDQSDNNRPNIITDEVNEVYKTLAIRSLEEFDSLVSAIVMSNSSNLVTINFIL